jgi:hypothetical protein
VSIFEGRDERVAKNEITFRDANESLHQKFRENGHDQEYPFLCECGDRSCLSLVFLSLDQYEEVRAHSARFLISVGHKQLESEQIVEDEPEFQVVEKTGRSGELADDAWYSDPRRRGSSGPDDRLEDNRSTSN